jgi:hypothetical protein
MASGLSGYVPPDVLQLLRANLLTVSATNLGPGGRSVYETLPGWGGSGRLEADVVDARA